MRVNIYAEEMTERLEIVTKEVDGNRFTALRFYLELPATVDGQQYSGPFLHRPGDDDSSAITFWGKRDLRVLLRKALAKLDAHYDESGTTEAKLEAATDLLKRAANRLAGDRAPDETWWPDLFELTGEHMILTDEGWQPGSEKQSYLDDHAKHPGWSDPILDEVNAPTAPSVEG